MQFNKVLSALGAVAVLAAVICMPACEREPVYIGGYSTDPADTTGNNGIPCNPDSVYFSQQILPILTSNCAMPGCHDAISHEDGIVLDNYQNVRNTGGIKLSNPADSKIYKVMKLSDPGDRMPPPPQPVVAAEQQALLLKWIQQGALNLSCEADCDTGNVKFSTTIMPVIETRCKGCHSGTSPQGGVSMTNYTQVRATAVNGSLWGSITHKNGFTAMPYPAGSAKIPECDIRKVKIWIDKGAQND